MGESYDYDVAVSFAGEDRDFVEAVVRTVTAAGYTVFYDQDEQVSLWGEELTEFFPKIYEERSRYAVVFVSRFYAAKPWTRLERRSVLVRALQQPTPYLLPVRLDDTQLPGVRTTISYLDGVAVGAHGVAAAIQRKLDHVQAASGGLFNGYVPRSEQQAAIVVGERPPGWEWQLFAYRLVRGVEELHDRYLDHSMGFADPTEFLRDGDVVAVVHREMAVVQEIIRNFGTVLSGPVQRSAFGPPGDVEQILHVASRYTSVYESFLAWAARLRGYAPQSVEAREVLQLLAAYTQQPVERMRSFVYELRALVDPMHSQLVSGQDVELVLEIPLEVSPAVSTEFERLMKRFVRNQEAKRRH